jgi:FkbM family methyltransferase
MTPGCRRVAVLAFADEVGADPGLLAAWAGVFNGGDDITLVVHPGHCLADEVAPLLRAAVRAAAIDDDEATAHILALAQRPLNGYEVELVDGCVASYGRRRPGPPFDTLPHVDAGDLPNLRGLLTTALPGSAGALPAHHQVASINNKWNLVHRGSPADLAVIAQIFTDQCYSLGPFGAWPGLARCQAPDARPPLIVDCGANIGASSMYFALLYPSAAVVALEPEPANYQLLEFNARPFPSICPLNQAIASRPGQLLLCDPGTGEWGYRTAAEAPDSKVIGRVESTTVEQILEQHPDREPFILKIDIEGAESDLFSEHTEAIGRFPLVIIELHDWAMPGKRPSEEFLRWHLTQERDFVYRGENVFSLASSLAAGPANDDRQVCKG